MCETEVHWTNGSLSLLCPGLDGFSGYSIVRTARPFTEGQEVGLGDAKRPYPELLGGIDFSEDDISGLASALNDLPGLEGRNWVARFPDSDDHQDLN